MGVSFEGERQLLVSPLRSEEAPLGQRNAAMIVGLILALGMGGLLLVFGLVGGLVVVPAGAHSGSDQD